MKYDLSCEERLGTNARTIAEKKENCSRTHALTHSRTSEFAWDSTGQEEDYVWGRYFGAIAEDRDSKSGGDASADALANLTLSAVLAYVPSTPHWAYNGAGINRELQRLSSRGFFVELIICHERLGASIREC